MEKVLKTSSRKKKVVISKGTKFKLASDFYSETPKCQMIIKQCL